MNRIFPRLRRLYTRAFDSCLSCEFRLCTAVSVANFAVKLCYVLQIMEGNFQPIGSIGQCPWARYYVIIAAYKTTEIKWEIESNIRLLTECYKFQ